MFAGKPIIGIVGGIGSGKSFVAKLFAELGCLVIDSDEQVRQAYRSPAVRETIKTWWGTEVFDQNGEVKKGVVASKVFDDPSQRQRLEQLLHPVVAKARDEQMLAHA